jgi:hypothetical protein
VLDIDRNFLFDDVLLRLVRLAEMNLVRRGWAALLVTCGKGAEGGWKNTKSSGGRTRRIGELRLGTWGGSWLGGWSAKVDGRSRTVYMETISCNFIAIHRMP